MSILDAARLKVLLVAGQWPAAPASGEPAYPARLQRLLEDRQVAACAECGCPMPGDPQATWSTCEPCEAGVGRHGWKWPRAAMLARLRRGDDSLTPAVARVLARTHRALEAPSWQELPGSGPGRPVEAWSHLALPVPSDRLVLANGTPAWPGVRVNPEVVEARAAGRPMMRYRVELASDDWWWPSWVEVARAALAEARNIEGAAAVVAPADLWPDLGWRACAWCGLSEVRRDSWLLIDGKPWCGVVSDCTRPNVGVVAANRAAAVAMLLDQPADLQLVERVRRTGRLPQPLLWSDLPDAERVPYDGPWGWWSDGDVAALAAVLGDAGRPNDEHVADAMRRNRADREAADRARAAEEARQAETIARAESAARRVAREEAAPARLPDEQVQQIVKKVTRDALVEHARESGPERVQVDFLGRPVPRGRTRR
jgi:hypothetical protein